MRHVTQGHRVYCIVAVVGLEHNSLVEIIIFQAGFQFRVLLLSQLPSQDKRTQSALLFNPSLWGKRWIYTFPNAICANVNLTNTEFELGSSISLSQPLTVLLSLNIQQFLSYACIPGYDDKLHPAARFPIGRLDVFRSLESPLNCQFPGSP